LDVAARLGFSTWAAVTGANHLLRAERISNMARIRYLVNEIDRSIAFYTKHLGFKLEHQAGTAFASVSRGDLTVLLSGPQSSGHRPLPDGRRQEPGGWNRIVLDVDDLASRVVVLQQAGLRFRSDIVAGPGGKQIQLEDPDGNPIELFEPAHSSS
jgi:glyoxylase I family protein